MEIDDKLKNRLAGTAVVTVLAIIFLPMMFDDPVEKKEQIVSELDIPRKPEVSPLLTAAIVPDKNTEVTAKPKPAVATNPSTEPAEDLTGHTEKSVADVSSEEEEKPPAPVKKKISKKVTADESVTEAEPVEIKRALPSAEEKKPVKHKAEKKPSKTELPVLNTNNQDKPLIASAPRLDAPPVLENHRWVVQVVSLSDQAKAAAFRDKLRAQGFPATIDSVWIKGKGRVYRLKVGPELDAQQAQSTKAKINQLHNVQSIAIPE